MDIKLFFTRDHHTVITVPDSANLTDIRAALHTLIQNEVLRSYDLKRDEVPVGLPYYGEDEVDEFSYSEGIEPEVVPASVPSLEKRLEGVQCRLDAGNLITSCQDCATSCIDGEAMFPENNCCVDQSNCDICRQVCYCT